MSHIGSFGTVRIFDDFLLDTDGLWDTAASAGCTTAVVAAGTAASYGRVALTNDGTANDTTAIGSRRGFQLADGSIAMEVRLILETGTVASWRCNVGFNDVVETAGTMPVTLSGTTWTSNSSNFCGFVFDAGATNADWHVFAVDDDVDTTYPIADLRCTGKAPVADTWTVLRIELHRVDATTARGEFYIDGVLVKALNDLKIDEDMVLSAGVHTGEQAAVAHTTYIDYIYAQGGRGDTVV